MAYYWSIFLVFFSKKTVSETFLGLQGQITEVFLKGLSWMFPRVQQLPFLGLGSWYFSNLLRAIRRFTEGFQGKFVLGLVHLGKRFIVSLGGRHGKSKIGLLLF